MHYEVREKHLARTGPEAVVVVLMMIGFDILAMTASQMRIAETIDTFYGDVGTRDGVSRSYKQAVEELDAETIKALDGPYRTTVVEPISRFCAYFPDINECRSHSSPPPSPQPDFLLSVADLTQASRSGIISY